MRGKRVLFIDAECVLCSGSAQWIAALDRGKKLSFSMLQGRAAADAIDRGLFGAGMTTVVYVRDFGGSYEQVFEKSSALIALGQDAGGWLRIFALLRLFPWVLRDGIYDLMARNRYRLFGKRKSCELVDTLQERRLQ